MSASARAWRGRVRCFAPDIVALALALLIGAPMIGQGTVIAYDMAWVPRPAWTPFVLGVGIPAPRAVPSDAVAVLLGRLVGAGPAQVLVVVGLLTGAGAGAARLLGAAVRVGTWARVASAVVAIWNPFVAERLAIGHWTVLVAYAVTPWAVRAAIACRVSEGAVSGTGGSRARLATVLAYVALASVGGANALIVVVPTVLGVLLVARPRSLRAPFAVAVVGVGASAAWSMPALGAGVGGDPSGPEVFAARADSAYGLVGALLTGGGFWNGASHLAARGSPLAVGLLTALTVVAVVAGMPRLWRSPARPLVVVSLVAFVVVLASGTPGVRGVWTWLVESLPGGGILRDSHKLLAPWMDAVALAVGVAVDRLGRWRRVVAWHPVPAVVASLAAVALQPMFAWGLDGRLVSVRVPGDYLATTATLSGQPEGLVGLLPWSQYRRYPWNGDRVALTVAPRLVDQQVLANDSLPTRAGEIAGEDPRAAAVTRAIAGGADPVAALRAQGVRFVLVETDSAAEAANAVPGGGAPTPAGPALPAGLDGARLLASGPSAAAYDLGGGGGVGDGVRPASAALRLGWASTLATWAVVLAVWSAPRSRDRRPPRREVT